MFVWYSTASLVLRAGGSGTLQGERSGPRRRRTASAANEGFPAERAEHAEGQVGRAMTENEIGNVVLEAAIAVHRDLGPGLLETVYEAVLADALSQRGLVVRRQVPIPIRYGGRTFEEGFRADLVVEEKVLLELKSVEDVHAVHKKQVHTYLRLSGLKLGYLLNFGQELMKAGITRCVNGL